MSKTIYLTFVESVSFLIWPKFDFFIKGTKGNCKKFYTDKIFDL